MAIDTAEKRRAVAGVPFFILGPGVTPNAAKDEEWRYQSAWNYSGDLTPPPPGSGDDQGRIAIGSKESLSSSVTTHQIGWSFS